MKRRHERGDPGLIVGDALWFATRARYDIQRVATDIDADKGGSGLPGPVLPAGPA
ncbi:MAG: hypothetical protein M3R02_15620 [Chloroflexota bacterium]|nr:hypothetical protein [Chloroflexota bacterium]